MNLIYGFVFFIIMDNLLLLLDLDKEFINKKINIITDKDIDNLTEFVSKRDAIIKNVDFSSLNLNKDEMEKLIQKVMHSNEETLNKIKKMQKLHRDKETKINNSLANNMYDNVVTESSFIDFKK